MEKLSWKAKLGTIIPDLQIAEQRLSAAWMAKSLDEARATIRAAQEDLEKIAPMLFDILNEPQEEVPNYQGAPIVAVPETPIEQLKPGYYKKGIV